MTCPGPGPVGRIRTLTSPPSCPPRRPLRRPCCRTRCGQNKFYGHGHELFTAAASPQLAASGLRPRLRRGAAVGHQHLDRGGRHLDRWQKDQRLEAGLHHWHKGPAAGQVTALRGCACSACVVLAWDDCRSVHGSQLSPHLPLPLQRRARLLVPVPGLCDVLTATLEAAYSVPTLRPQPALLTNPRWPRGWPGRGPVPLVARPDPMPARPPQPWLRPALRRRGGLPRPRPTAGVGRQHPGAH